MKRASAEGIGQAKVNPPVPSPQVCQVVLIPKSGDDPAVTAAIYSASDGEARHDIGFPSRDGTDQTFASVLEIGTVHQQPATARVG
jgi:hypothetical protein